MKKTIIAALVLAIGLCCSPAMALEREQKAGSGITAWLKGLQNRIAQIVPKKTVPMNTAVAGVRGAKEHSEDKLYWKGKKVEETATEEEVVLFKGGIDLATKGDNAAAVKELETFMTKYPDSPLIPDAKKTLDLVQAEPQEKTSSAQSLTQGAWNGSFFPRPD